MITVKQVYTAGGMPELSFVDRKVADKRQELLDSVDSNNLVTVTGNTKTGKTVLVNKYFPKSTHVWVDAGSIKDETEFWETISEQLDLYDQTEKATELSGNVGGEVKGSAAAGILVAKASTEASASIGGGISRTTRRSKSTNKKILSINGLRESKKVLVIDDFHYLTGKLQQSIIRALKGLIFDGLNVVCIAIPHRKYDAVMVEREMNGRVTQVTIPEWEEAELIDIAKTGEQPLNISYDTGLLSILSREALGSPHLMQKYLIELLIKDYAIRETQKDKRIIDVANEVLFSRIANETGNEVFKKLAYGPRQRSDRKKRILKNGRAVDIYKLVILTLLHIKPGLIKIRYVPEIRNAMRDLIDELPQVNEVSRVFEKMKEIALSDNSSVAVLEWNKAERELIITDPFFALYLKHGTIE